ncbi:MAG: response regulator [Nitrospirae bacterium]|nr:response regulator [Nitrospirota bacterium]
MPDNAPRILVLDDEAMILELCTAVLSTEGYLIDTVSDGNDAIALLDKNKYDAIISDMKMPSLNGSKFYEIIKINHPELSKKIIFITGDVMNIETKAFLEKTNVPYLIKPFRLNDLKEAVRRVL